MLTFMPTYLLRDMPAVLWRRVRAQAALEGVSVRDLIMRLLEQYVGDKFKNGSHKS